jgi:hypothetical protein
MAKVVELRPPHPLVGTWFHPNNDSTAEFTITAESGGFAVSGVDTGDGERFEISEVTWSGEVLSFTSFMPSTQWRTRHVFRIISDSQVEHERTDSEIWCKR